MAIKFSIAQKKSVITLKNHKMTEKLTQTGKISKEYLKTLLPENPIILEAGGHIGRDTIKMKKIWPESTIYTFEPVPALFEQLKKNTAHLKQVYCYPYALSNKTGKQTLYVSSGRSDACSSLKEPKECLETNPTIIFENTIEVPTITIDEWAQQNNIKKIDFMWLDLQGAELEALKSAQTILANTHVIHVEINITERYKNMPLFEEIDSWLQKQNFRCDIKTMHHETWGDALYIKKNDTI